MFFFVIFGVTFISNTLAAATGEAVSSTTVTPQTIETFIPHKVYPYAETYPSSAYDNYLIPLGPVYRPEDETKDISEPPTGLSIFLKTFTRISIYVVGTAAAILIGALFTSLLCSYTPFCTLTFNGFRKINHDSVRSLVNPDNISAAASFVQDAVDKYQRLQRQIKY